MKKVDYKTKGICARNITIVLDDDNVIQSVEFDGGCPGNHLGLEALCIGRKAEEVVNCLSGIRCGSKDSSCPDQLSLALKGIL